MITELTKEQEDKIIDYGLKWTQIGLNTDPVDVTLAMEAIKQAYESAGLRTGPKAYLGPFNNPVECAKAQVMVKRLPRATDFSQLRNIDIPAGTEFTAEELYTALDEQVFGYQEASWLGYYEFIKNEFGISELDHLDGLEQVAENIGWWAAYDQVAFFQQRPEEIHLNDKGELHNENGPAVKWRGTDRTYDVWAINGEVQEPRQ
jgi:hypothetical protein